MMKKLAIVLALGLGLVSVNVWASECSSDSGAENCRVHSADGVVECS
jgi:hypothetical protein